MSKPIKVLFIIPPCILPTYVPLGPAQLKSYVEKQLPSVNICIKDYNLRYFDDTISEIKKSPSAYKAHQLAIDAAEKFRGKTQELFTKNYDDHARNFIGYFRDLIESTTLQVEKALQEGSAPPKHFDTYLAEIVKEKPDVIGFSLMLTSQFPTARYLGLMIKGLLPNVKIFCGGSMFGTEAEEYFDATWMDVLVHGEGEEALTQLLRKYSNNLIDNSSNNQKDIANYNQIPGIVYQDSKGKIIITPRKELDSLANIPLPNFSNYNLEKYYNPELVIPVHMSRSCPWKRCTYCTHYKGFQKYRAKTVEQFYSEIKQYYDSGIHFFNFIDEMVPPGFLRQFCNKVIETNLKIRWHAIVKATGFTGELFELMYKAGCRVLFWGIESGSQKILDAMDKGTTVEEMSTILYAAHNAKIKNYIMIIMGFPGETRTEWKETEHFMEKNKSAIDAVSVSPFFLYKGTKIFENPKEFNILQVNKGCACDKNFSYSISKGLTPDEITVLYNDRQDFFGKFSSYSESLNYLRDHALVYYSWKEKKQKN